LPPNGRAYADNTNSKEQSKENISEKISKSKKREMENVF
jgi:hypothetical protein